MIDLDQAFAALPPPLSDSSDAGKARHIWLRARIAAIVDDDGRRSARVTRLRMASALIAIIAADAIVPLLLASAAAPLIAILGALAITHAAASLALLRA
ncbi:MAG TPA: hypothetical protein VF713_06480 [Thermoanaerobaculia bacterium]